MQSYTDPNIRAPIGTYRQFTRAFLQRCFYNRSAEQKRIALVSLIFVPEPSEGCWEKDICPLSLVHPSVDLCEDWGLRKEEFHHVYWLLSLWCGLAPSGATTPSSAPIPEPAGIVAGRLAQLLAGGGTTYENHNKAVTIVRVSLESFERAYHQEMSNFTDLYHAPFDTHFCVRYRD